MHLPVFVLKSMRKSYSYYSDLLEKINNLCSENKNNSNETTKFEKSVSLYNQDANDYCRRFLESGKSCMISKFGTIELNALIQYKSILQKKYSSKDYIDFIKRKRPTLWWNEEIHSLCNNAGFFPDNNNLLPKFYRVYKHAIKEIDILGSYLEGENYFNEELKDSCKINIDGYYAPFYYKNPWTKILKNKKVLVIHPFEDSIKNQYKKRNLLWKDKDVLPEFELITIKAEQTMLGISSQYKTWFEALDAMKAKMQTVNFDIALIGCGAYGMPLAAHAKSLGKQAIHLAGWTQILFGIRGKRWENIPEVAKFINSHWAYPLESEKPNQYKIIENGCYW